MSACCRASSQFVFSCSEAARIQTTSDVGAFAAGIVAAAYVLLGALFGAVHGVVHGVNGDYMVQRAFPHTISYRMYKKTIRSPQVLAFNDKKVGSQLLFHHLHTDPLFTQESDVVEVLFIA